jgi:hypothetical protein
MLFIPGNLHFANVANEDGEKLYSCYASLPFLGFYSKGPSTSITVIGRLESVENLGIIDMLHTIVIHTIQRYGTLSLWH